jgi:hypothetical protein
MSMSTQTRREDELRLTPGTREYDEEQAMWESLNAARHEVLAYLGTAPPIEALPTDYICAA